MGMIRILFLADTHLGFDQPFKPRIKRRRRGPDFFSNFRKALETAVEQKVDCVVHGGDLFYRSKVPPDLVAMAFEPLHEVTAHGIPVYLVPGNHERSVIPHALLAQAPKLFIFDRPRSFILDQTEGTVSLSGFPFIRANIRKRFPEILGQTKWNKVETNCRLLCIHQSVEGAVVGPSGYIFRYGPDVIRGSDIPLGISAVLSGHIHRAQVLTNDINGEPLPAPVLYPGSVERTSFAEKDEVKGFFLLEVDPTGHNAPQWTFEELYARPMREIEIWPSKTSADGWKEHIRRGLLTFPEDSIVKLRICGEIPSESLPHLRAEVLRSLAPQTMNLEVRFPTGPGVVRFSR